MPKKPTFYLYWLVTFILFIAVSMSGLFMLTALLLSLWAGVFWYGVSLTTTGAVLRLWIDFLLRRT